MPVVVTLVTPTPVGAPGTALVLPVRAVDLTLSPTLLVALTVME